MKNYPFPQVPRLIEALPFHIQEFHYEKSCSDAETLKCEGFGAADVACYLASLNEDLVLFLNNWLEVG